MKDVEPFLPVITESMKKALLEEKYEPKNATLYLKEYKRLDYAEMKKILDYAPRNNSTLMMDYYYEAPDYSILKELLELDKDLTPAQIRLLKKLNMTKAELKELLSPYDSKTKKNLLPEFGEEMHLPHELRSFKNMKTWNPEAHKWNDLYKKYVLDSTVLKQLTEWLKKAGIPQGKKGEKKQLDKTDYKAFLEHFKQEASPRSVDSILESYKANEFRYLNDRSCLESIKINPYLRKYRGKHNSLLLEQALEGLNTKMSDEMKAKIVAEMDRIFGTTAKKSAEKPDSSEKPDSTEPKKENTDEPKGEN